MFAFTQTLPLTEVRPARSAHVSGRWTCRVRPGFRSGDEDDEPVRSLTSEVAPSEQVPRTPNERALDQVRESMKRLGVSEEDSIAPPPPRKPIDISNVNPLAALSGGIGAAAIAFVLWNMLQISANFFITHPYESDFYVVARISAVVRTTIVGVLALASGISGVTSVGLTLLAGRTTIAAITGEFRKEGSVQGK